MRPIDADALEKEGWSLHRTIRVDMNTSEYQTKQLKQVPTIEPERVGDPDRIYTELSKVYNTKGLSDEVYSIIGDLMISLSDEPEIIRCKDCKWWAVIPNDDSELSDYRACYALKHCRTKAIDFCSRAERRTDEGSD